MTKYIGGLIENNDIVSDVRYIPNHIVELDKIQSGVKFVFVQNHFANGITTKDVYMRVNQDVKPRFEDRATDAVIVNIKSGELYTINKWVSVQPLTTNEVIKNGKET